MTSDDLEVVRALRWQADAAWWVWTCDCGAQHIIVPPPRLLESGSRQEPATNRTMQQLVCCWCGDEGQDGDCDHIEPGELLR